MFDTLGDSLDRALEGAFTRRIPQSAQAQMKYLVKQLKGTKAAVQALGISQRTVERYVAGKLRRLRRNLRGRLEGEVKKRWQPQVRAKVASTGGLVVSTRARFGLTAAPGTTDDARMRDITQALPPEYGDQLFTAREQGRHRAAAPADRGRRPRSDVPPRQQQPGARPGRGVHRRRADRDRAVAGPDNCEALHRVPLGTAAGPQTRIPRRRRSSCTRRRAQRRRCAVVTGRAPATSHSPPPPTGRSPRTRTSSPAVHFAAFCRYRSVWMLHP